MPANQETEPGASAEATDIPEIRTGALFVAWVGRVVYRLLGWKVIGKTPAQAKFVILAAPHTSNWDGFYLLLAAAMLRLRFSFFGKDSLFQGPLGWFLRSMGGIPLDRSRHQSLVSQAVSWFERLDTFAIGVAPEGTRHFTPGWKTGFYYIALQAKVPVVFGFIDYARKEAGILDEVLVPTGDIEKDFEVLRRNYGPRTARHPERKGPIVPLTHGRGRTSDAPEVGVEVGAPEEPTVAERVKATQGPVRGRGEQLMASVGILQKTRDVALRIFAALDFVPGVLTRLIVGFAFIDSGSGKLKNMENTVNFFSTLGIPFPELNAAFVARLEYYGGMLILVGLLTRVVGLLLSSTMIVALLTADRETFVGALMRSGEVGLSDVAPFVLGAFLSWLVIKGPGALSLDALLKRALFKDAATKS